MVGVDGSEQSYDALTWAAAEAARRDLDVEAVMSYAIPTFVATAMDAGYAALDDRALRSGAEQVLREVVKAIRDGVKFDALVGGPSPIGSDEEMIGMGEVSGAAEDYYTDALDAQLRADGRK